MAAALKAISAFLRRFPWHRFAAGAIAGGGALIITLILRTLGLGLFLPEVAVDFTVGRTVRGDRKSTRLNSSHVATSYAVFCFKKKNSTDEEHCNADWGNKAEA